MCIVNQNYQYNESLIIIVIFRQLKWLHSFSLFRMSSPLSALTRHFPPEGASTSKYYGYIPAPGQTGGKDVRRTGRGIVFNDC